MEFFFAGTGLIIALFFGLLFLALPIIAIIHLLQSEFRDSTTKLIWALVIFFMPFIGPILYFLIGRNQRINVS